MYAYNHAQLNVILQEILEKTLVTDAWSWLDGEAQAMREKGDIARFNGAFVRVPRITGKALLRPDADREKSLDAARENFSIKGWTADRLARVWLVLHLSADDRDQYFQRIENLFLAADMAELTALYSSLPLLAYPEMWRKRCAEGIRSNIGQVLEAVICRNPYPSEQLDELAWNQLVLKALFTEQPVLEIVGLQGRRNRNLALSLIDYAHERWAAHREVNPLLWICVAPFLSKENIDDVRRLLASPNEAERHAAGLMCAESDDKDAKALLEQNPEIMRSIENGKISWQTVAALQKP